MLLSLPAAGIKQKNTTTLVWISQNKMMDQGGPPPTVIKKYMAQSPPGDSIRDLFIHDRCKSLRLWKGHMKSPSRKGHQQNCQAHIYLYGPCIKLHVDIWAMYFDLKVISRWWFQMYIFHFHHYLGEWSNLTKIFFRWVGSTTNWIWMDLKKHL